MTQESIELKRIALTGGAWSLASTWVTALLSMGSALLLARLLSPADFGTYAMAMVVLDLFASFTGLGIGMALIQKQDLTREEISSMLWLYIFSNLTIFVFITAISPFIAIFFNDPLISKLLPITALSYIIGAAGYLYAWLLEKELAFALLAKQELFAALVATSVTIGLAFCGVGIWSLVWGYLTGCTIVSILRVWAGWSRWKPQLHFKWSDIRKFLRFGLYEMGEGALLTLGSRLDQLLIGWLLGVPALGVYEFVAMRLLNPLCTISQILLRNAFPLLAKIQYEKTLLRQSFVSLTKLLNNIEAPLLFGTGAIAPILIPLLFGKEWLQAAPLVPLLAAAQMFRRINSQSGTLLMATGKPELSFRWNLLLLLASSTAMIPGALYGGISGVATAVLLTTAVGTIAGYFILIKPILGECGKVLTAAIFKPVLLSIIIGILIRLLASCGNSTISRLVITSIVGLVLYFGLLWILERNTVSAWNES